MGKNVASLTTGVAHRNMNIMIYGEISGKSVHKSYGSKLSKIRFKKIDEN